MFSDPVYGPDSDFVEGTPKLLTPVELNVDGLTKIFDNSKGKDPLHIAYEEEVELENSVSTSVSETPSPSTSPPRPKPPSPVPTPAPSLRKS